MSDGSGTRKVQPNSYTQAEDDIIRKFYPSGGHDLCSLNGLERSVPSVQQRAKAIGVKRVFAGPKPNQRRHEVVLEKTGGPRRYFHEWKPLKKLPRAVIREGSRDAYNLPSLR